VVCAGGSGVEQKQRFNAVMNDILFLREKKERNQLHRTQENKCAHNEDAETVLSCMIYLIYFFNLQQHAPNGWGSTHQPVK